MSLKIDRPGGPDPTTCTLCTRAHYAGSYCQLHYHRYISKRSLHAPIRAARGKGRQTTIRSSVDQLTAWQRAAKRARQSLREWIRKTLDREAE